MKSTNRFLALIGVLASAAIIVAVRETAEFLFVLALVFALCVGVVRLLSGKTVHEPAIYIAFGFSFFTSEAALGGAGVQAGTLTPAKILPIACLIVLCSAYFMRYPRIRKMPQVGWLLLVYLGWLALTSVFGVNPFESLLRVAQWAVPVVMFIVLSTRQCRHPQAALLAILAGSVAHVAYTLLLDRRYVGVEGSERLVGLLIANRFGLMAGIAVTISFALLLTAKRFSLLYVLIIAAGAWAMFESQARTAAIGTLLSVLIALALFAPAPEFGLGDRRAIRGRRIALFTLILSLGISLLSRPSVGASLLLSFIGSNQDIGTLTGRLPLWENLWEAVISRPLIGFGFGAHRGQSPELDVYLSPEQLRLSVAHNALIEAVVASGLVGGLLRLALIGMVILTTWRARGSWSPAARALLMLLLVSSLTGSHTAGIGIGWYALLAVAFLVSHQPTPTDHKDMAESTRERYIRSSASRWNF